MIIWGSKGMPMDLREKLQLFKNKSVSVPPDQSSNNRHAIDAVIEGDYISTPFGPCFVAESRYALSHYHGNSTLFPRFVECPEVLHTLGLDEFDKHSSFVFLDTETTGLSRGTGTYVFLVGVGQYYEDSFVIRQYFLRDLPEEWGMLYLVNELLSETGVLVTYNGRSFDVPLLETRFTCSRMQTNILSIPHLDLLHPTRRLWKERIGSCALSNVELQILGVERSGDVPGSMIPSLYFEYLETKNARPLQPVFYHNCQDILSLAVLLNHMVWTMDVDCGCKDMQNPGDVYRAGKIYESVGDLDAAEACYNLVIEGESRKYQKRNSLWSLSKLLKRQGRLDEAVAIWKCLLEQDDLNVGIAPYIELAKYYEHKAKDYESARGFVLEAMEVLEKRSALLREGSSIHNRQFTALSHRLDRLDRKLTSRKAKREQ